MARIESSVQPTGRQTRVLGWGTLIFVLIGAAAMVYLNGAGLTDGSRYHMDLTQSPHWMAYHGDRFPADDLLVEYATFNESPVQNAIYWTGTLLIDVVLLNKLVGVAIFGLTAGLFFLLGSLISGPWVGSLAALFFIVFPRGSYEIAGGFSKAWAIGLVLLAVYVVESRRFSILPWAMPLAALAYPVAPVLMGAIVAVGLALELPGGTARAIRGLKYLAGASALGVLPLLYKYVTPPERIGDMISTAWMKEMWQRGESSSYTLPLWEEVYSYFSQPFFIYGTVLLLMLLWRRGPVWQRSWTALVVASTISYYVADLVVPQLYLPDRYSRFSVAVLLVLWLAHNVVRAVEPLRSVWGRRAALAGVVVLAALSFETFRPCAGDPDQGIWEDRRQTAAMSRAIDALPSPVLVAGHPNYTADVVVQARQPVLVINRMYHAWFAGYRKLIDERNRDIFAALYARQIGPVNRLAHRYDVTHLIVRKQHYRGSAFRAGRIYREEYRPFIASLTAGQGAFVLDPPPRDAVVFEDPDFWLVRLPLE